MAIAVKDAPAEHSNIEPEKAKRINDHVEKAQKAFEEWVADPSHKLRLDMPHDALRAFIPRRVYELAEDPDSVDIVIATQDDKNTHLYFVEHKSEPLTNIDSLVRHKRETDTVKLADIEDIPLPEDVDQFHVEALEPHGPLKINDYVFCEAALHIINNDQIYVGGYWDREELHKKGLARGFYNRLRDGARKIGARFIINENDDANIGYFTEKLGMHRLTEIRRSFRGKFIPLNDIMPFLRPLYRHNPPEEYCETFTVDFLNPEDNKKYLEPEPQTPRGRLKLKAGYAS